MILLEVVVIDSALKGRGAEISCDFTHPLSRERPSKFLHHHLK